MLRGAIGEIVAAYTESESGDERAVTLKKPFGVEQSENMANLRRNINICSYISIVGRS
jgi:hypothetical protein